MYNSSKSVAGDSASDISDHATAHWHRMHQMTCTMRTHQMQRALVCSAVSAVALTSKWRNGLSNCPAHSLKHDDASAHAQPLLTFGSSQINTGMSDRAKDRSATT